ncbi:MAG: cation-translocating P-type ATPase [Bdellovibrionota bacterium]
MNTLGAQVQEPAKTENRTGLSSPEAQKRLLEYGPNEIKREVGPSIGKLLLRQFTSPLVWLLLGACVLSGLLGEWIDAIAISAIIILNGVVGFFQEYRAERAVAALLSLSAPRARVLRDGRSVIIPSRDVVPGDVLVLDAGDLVAADSLLLEANGLLIDEAALTGESVPVEKTVGVLDKGTHLAERTNSIFLGTNIVSGSGKALVETTGMNTELGKIAHLLAQTQDTQTPLQKRLGRVSHALLKICLALVAAVAILGAIRQLPWLELVMSSVSLAVAAVPEGLPAIVTIALALGVQRMAARNVLVRNMPAIETLGSTTVICTDKTGTLTTGSMRIRELWGADHKHLLYAAAACCDAELNDDQVSGTGDPTEIAILISAAERGIAREHIEKELPRDVVNPFDSDRKRMSIYRKNNVLYVKGAAESLLKQCIEQPSGVLEATSEMAARGLRVLAVALGNSPKEENLKFIGLLGIADPPRTEAIEAIAQARTAGIRTIMITGDHPVTARAIAQELGIVTKDESHRGLVHARVTPEDKINIVQEWKDKNEVVAMTGDGVNDAPALKKAHVGIAMGRAGTEVAKEASDMILTDDNFASIVAAIREGRGVYDNIRKAVVYLLTGNASELTVMLLAALAGLPVPLLPIHLLWINLVTDGLPALALVMDPTSSEAMKRPPRRPDEPMLGRPEWKRIGITALLEGTLILATFIVSLKNSDVKSARNFAFTTLVFSQMFRAFSARSTTRIFWEVGALSNLWLLGVIFLTMFLQAAIHHLPLTQRFLELSPISVREIALALAIGLIPVTLIELQKLAHRYWRTRRNVSCLTD